MVQRNTVQYYRVQAAQCSSALTALFCPVQSTCFTGVHCTALQCKCCAGQNSAVSTCSDASTAQDEAQRPSLFLAERRVSAVPELAVNSFHAPLVWLGPLFLHLNAPPPNTPHTPRNTAHSTSSHYTCTCVHYCTVTNVSTVQDVTPRAGSVQYLGTQTRQHTIAT